MNQKEIVDQREVRSLSVNEWENKIDYGQLFKLTWLLDMGSRDNKTNENR